MSSPRLTPALVLISGLLLSTCSGLAEDPPLCEPGAMRCQLDKHVEICTAAGDAWQHMKSCAAHETCVDGTCVAGCAPACEGVDCGDDGCGGSCGACDEGYYCWEGECLYGHCEPDCAGKACGDDGCGGQCDTCIEDYSCEEGVCVPDCLPNCENKECGSDGCFGTCGHCELPDSCSVNGLCECVAVCTDNDGVALSCGTDGCGGSCGQCTDGALCVEGTCEVYDECPAEHYLCGTSCCVADDLCNVINGAGPFCCEKEKSAVCIFREEDQKFEVAWIDSCGQPWHTAEICEADCVAGTCQLCVPACAGKQCGEDGCGGNCGSCPVDSGCQDGLCVEGLCNCTSGPCCDDCNFEPASTICAWIEETLCVGDCGGAVEIHEHHQYCSGHDSLCTGNFDQPKKVDLVDDCAAAEMCVEAPTPNCVAAADICNGTGTGGGGEDCDNVEPDSYETSTGEDNDAIGTAALAIPEDKELNTCNPLVGISATLHSTGDIDWYMLQTNASGCAFNPKLTFPSDTTNAIKIRCWSGAGHVYTGNSTPPEGCVAVGVGDGMGYGVLCEDVGPSMSFADLKCGEADWGAFDTAMRIWFSVAGTGEATCGGYTVTLD